MGSDPLFTDGVIVIDKPAGPTSHDVVAVMRRALVRSTIGRYAGQAEGRPYRYARSAGVRRAAAGHRQSHPPRAISVVCRKRVRSGHRARRDDNDARSRRRYGRRAIRTRAAAELTPQMIEDAVAEFRGTYLQQPPAFSAKKIDGDRAYDLARRNAPVQLQPVEVTATALDVVEWSGTTLQPAARVLRRVLRAVAGRRHRRAPRDRRASRRARADAQRRLHAGRRCRAGHAGSQSSRGCRADHPTRGAAAVPAGAYPDSRRSLTGSPRRIHSTLAGGMPRPALPQGGRVRLLHPDGHLVAIAEPRGR